MGLQECCILLIAPATNVFVIATCSILLREAMVLQHAGGTKHGDEWVNKLITWSIVGICVGVFQTIFLICWFWLVRNLPNASTKLRNSRIVFSIVQLILIALILTAVIIPGIAQWPDSYRETDWAMYSAIWFIGIYIIPVIAIVRSLLAKENPHLTNAI